MVMRSARKQWAVRAPLLLCLLMVVFGAQAQLKWDNPSSPQPAPGSPWGTPAPLRSDPAATAPPKTAPKGRTDVAPVKAPGAALKSNPLAPKTMDAAPLVLIGLKQAPLSISAPMLNLIGLRPSPISISAAQLMLVGLRAAPLTVDAPQIVLVGLREPPKSSLQPRAVPGGK